MDRLSRCYLCTQKLDLKLYLLTEPTWCIYTLVVYLIITTLKGEKIRVSVLLCGEFTDWFSSQRDSNADLCCFFVDCMNKLLNKHSVDPKFETSWRSFGVAVMFPIGLLGANFSEIYAKLQQFLFNKMDMKISSAYWSPLTNAGNIDWIPSHCRTGERLKNMYELFNPWALKIQPWKWVRYFGLNFKGTLQNST